MTGSRFDEATGMYPGIPQVNDQSRMLFTSVRVTAAICSNDKQFENDEECLPNSLPHKRKLMTLPGSSKRQKTNGGAPISNDKKNIHKNVHVQVAQQSCGPITVISKQAQLHHLPGATQVKMRYIMAEKEVRRERNQYGRASEEAIDALTSAGESMRAYLDQKVEAVRMYWEYEVDDLIASEKVMIRARRRTAQDNAQF